MTAPPYPREAGLRSLLAHDDGAQLAVVADHHHLTRMRERRAEQGTQKSTGRDTQRHSKTRRRH